MSDLSHVEKAIALSTMAEGFEEAGLHASDLLIDAAALTAIATSQRLEELIERLRESYAMLDATKDVQSFYGDSQIARQ